MNLLAFSKQDPTIFFVAEVDKISCFRVEEEDQHPFQTLQVIANRSSIGRETWLDRRIPINSIHVGSLGTAEVLVSVDEAGQVRLWYTSNLEHSPICLTVE